MTDNPEEMHERQLLKWENVKARMEEREKDVLVRGKLTTPSTLSRSYHQEWVVNNRAYQCSEWWDEQGFRPDFTCFPRAVGLLVATTYSKAVVESEGLFFYFSNTSGYYLPEVVECLTELALSEFVEVLTAAQRCLGHPFPRAKVKRIPLVNKNRDLLENLTTKFREASTRLGQTEFDRVCNEYLNKSIKMNNLKES